MTFMRVDLPDFRSGPTRQTVAVDIEPQGTCLVSDTDRAESQQISFYL